MAQEGETKLQHVRRMLAELTQPLFRDSPFHKLTNRYSTSNEKPSLGFHAFVERINTFKPQSWAINPNAAVYLAKHGWQNTTELYVQCSCCKTVLDCTPMLRKRELLKVMVTHGHQADCRWSCTYTPAYFFKIPRCPQTSFDNLRSTWEELRNLNKILPVIPKETLTAMSITDDFIESVLKGFEGTVNSVDVSALVLGLCGWVRESETCLRCSFCQRVLGLWNFYSVQDGDGENMPPIIPDRKPKHIISVLYSKIREGMSEGSGPAAAVEKKSAAIESVSVQSVSDDEGAMNVDDEVRSVSDIGSNSESASEVCSTEVEYPDYPDYPEYVIPHHTEAQITINKYKKNAIKRLTIFERTKENYRRTLFQRINSMTSYVLNECCENDNEMEYEDGDVENVQVNESAADDCNMTMLGIINIVGGQEASDFFNTCDNFNLAVNSEKERTESTPKNDQSEVVENISGKGEKQCVTEDCEQLVNVSNTSDHEQLLNIQNTSDKKHLVNVKDMPDNEQQINGKNTSDNEQLADFKNSFDTEHLSIVENTSKNEEVKDIPLLVIDHLGNEQQIVLVDNISESKVFVNNSPENELVMKISNTYENEESVLAASNKDNLISNETVVEAEKSQNSSRELSNSCLEQNCVQPKPPLQNNDDQHIAGPNSNKGEEPLVEDGGGSEQECVKSVCDDHLDDRGDSDVANRSREGCAVPENGNVQASPSKNGSFNGSVHDTHSSNMCIEIAEVTSCADSERELFEAKTKECGGSVETGAMKDESCEVESIFLRSPLEKSKELVDEKTLHYTPSSNMCIKIVEVTTCADSEQELFVANTKDCVGSVKDECHEVESKFLTSALEKSKMQVDEKTLPNGDACVSPMEVTDTVEGCENDTASSNAPSQQNMSESDLSTYGILHLSGTSSTTDGNEEDSSIHHGNRVATKGEEEIAETPTQGAASDAPENNPKDDDCIVIQTVEVRNGEPANSSQEAVCDDAEGSKTTVQETAGTPPEVKIDASDHIVTEQAGGDEQNATRVAENSSSNIDESSKKGIEEGACTSRKRKLNDHDDEPPQKRFAWELCKSYFHPELEHRFWCLWRIATCDNNQEHKTDYKKGWQFVMEDVPKALAQSKSELLHMFSSVNHIRELSSQL